MTSPVNTPPTESEYIFGIALRIAAEQLSKVVWAMARINPKPFKNKVPLTPDEYIQNWMKYAAKISEGKHMLGDKIDLPLTKQGKPHAIDAGKPSANN